jgi:D-sedoheptulose 7-phosphate isomerase
MGKVILSAAQTYLEESAAVLLAVRDDETFIASLVEIAGIIETCFRGGGKVMLAGNGGSAGDAQHIAGEFLSRLNFDRAPLPAIALSSDTSVLTAVGNDYGFEYVFERQVRGLGRRGDVLIGISTSGRSVNVVRAVAAAKELGLTTVGFVGDDPRDMGPFCDISLRAPSQKTPLIQQIHMIAAHIVCGQVEQSLFGGSR